MSGMGYFLKDGTGVWMLMVGNIKMKMGVFLCLVGVLMPAHLLAQDVGNFAGMGGSWSNSPYVGVGGSWDPMPLVNYDSKYVFISGYAGGVHVWADDAQQFDVAFEYQDLELRPSDSSDWRIKQLDHRKTTFLAGFTYSLTTHFGQLSAEAVADVLDRSHTFSFDVEYAASFEPITGLTLIPQLGATWFNGSHHRYYYGVSAQEAARSGLKQYRPGSGWMPYAVLTATYAFSPKFLAVMEYELDWLSSAAKSSPMVNRSHLSTLTLGLVYRF